jgi:alanine dehydrogenase
MTVILSEADLDAALTMQDCIEAVEAAQIQFSAGETIMPTRLVVPLPGGASHFSMPAALPGLPALGSKSIALFPANAARGLPTILGVVVLNDPETGAVLAVLNGQRLTAVRTAAASAVATRALARPESRTLALLGTGIQAESHLRAMTEVLQLETVHVASRTRESARRFVEEQRDLYPDLELIAEHCFEDAIRAADVICTLTAAKRPVTHVDWIRPGAHINAVGAHRPTDQEIDPETMLRARVVVDSREANLSECGDCMVPIAEGLFGPEHVSDEIGEVLAGRRTGRSSDTEITIYESCGLAVQDIAAAAAAYRAARARGLGTVVRL